MKISLVILFGFFALTVGAQVSLKDIKYNDTDVNLVQGRAGASARAKTEAIVAKEGCNGADCLSKQVATEPETPYSAAVSFATDGQGSSVLDSQGNPVRSDAK